jgi:hypothetical protein
MFKNSKYYLTLIEVAINVVKGTAQTDKKTKNRLRKIKKSFEIYLKVITALQNVKN